MSDLCTQFKDRRNEGSGRSDKGCVGDAGLGLGVHAHMGTRDLPGFWPVHRWTC